MRNYISIDRFSSLKTYFGSCLRLAKLFKLTDLIEEFHKKLYTINIEANNEKRSDGSITSQVSANISNTLSNLNTFEGDIKLTNYDTNVSNPPLPIDEADIFR